MTHLNCIKFVNVILKKSMKRKLLLYKIEKEKSTV